MGSKYKIEVQNINEAGQVPSDGCNCITFYNPPGNTGTLYVNDMPITPGNMFMVAGLAGEQDFTVYNVNFTVSEKYFYIRKNYLQ